MSKGWYQRTNSFTPYTKADGQAVSDEFDAIQASFERIPEMRDDGKGFKVSPIIPAPTNPNHPVTLSMLRESEKSIDTAKDLVLKKAQQVETATATVVRNTQATEQAKKAAVSAAVTVTQNAQSASASEAMAKKWAAHPLDQIVQSTHYSALHYATKAKESEQNSKTASDTAVSAKNTAVTSAASATRYAKEAAESAKQAKNAAFGKNEWKEIANVPRASTSTSGITQHYSGYDSDSETMSLTAKAGKALKALIDSVVRNLANYIPNSKKSSAVNSNSADTVATSAAVKTAYDKGVEALNKANAAVPKESTVSQMIKAGRYNFALQSDGQFFIYDTQDNNAIKFGTNRVFLKSGGIVTGSVFVEGEKAGGRHYGINLINKGESVNTGTYIDASFLKEKIPKAGVFFYDPGNWAGEVSILTTQRQPNRTEGIKNKRETHTAFRQDGAIWNKNYGLLHDYFAKSDGFQTTYYPNHYNSAQVFKSSANRLMITIMYKNMDKVGMVNGKQFILNLPEKYNGLAIAMANVFFSYTVGAEEISIPAHADVIDNGTKVKIHCNASYGAAIKLIVIGVV